MLDRSRQSKVKLRGKRRNTILKSAAIRVRVISLLALHKGTTLPGGGRGATRNFYGV